jgi:hypothetical protein
VRRRGDERATRGWLYRRHKSAARRFLPRRRGQVSCRVLGRLACWERGLSARPGIKDIAASPRRLPADCKAQPGRADCRRFISTSCQDRIQCRSTDRRPRVQSRKLPRVCQVCTRIGSLHCCLGESATLAAFSSLLRTYFQKTVPRRSSRLALGSRFPRLTGCPRRTPGFRGTSAAWSQFDEVVRG